jgi:hypothetical protein
MFGSFSGVLSKHGHFPGLMSFAPDDGAPAGGTALADPPDGVEPEPSDDTPPEATYTKADVERMALQRVKRLTKDAQAKDKKIEALEEELKKLSEQITEKLNEPSIPPVVGGAGDESEAELRRQQGHWEVQRTRFESTVKDLQGKLGIAEKELIKVKQERMNMERDLEIDKALSSPSVQCIDVDNARILVRDRVEYDQTEEEWIFRTKSGNILPVKEGIEAELPDYLRPSNLRQGGSGATSGGPKASAQRRKLDDKRKELSSVTEQIKKAPRNNDLLVRASKLRREVAALEKSI